MEKLNRLGDFDYSYNQDLEHSQKARTAPRATRFRRIRSVATWQQGFQIVVASTCFLAGAGVGREILHDPLATAEGVLNFPVIVSQLAVIFCEAFLVNRRICTS